MQLSDVLVTLFSYIKQSGKRILIKEAFKISGGKGLEIGGPTAFFGLKGGFPIYVFANIIDGVNFSTETVWEGKIEGGAHYHYYKNKNGHQYIAEATDLSQVKNNHYDFVLSSHSLEHVANPIKALKEWNRILKEGGKLVVILPNKTHTFDHKRSYTSYEHLILDFEKGTTEEDDTHLAEILETHDAEKTGIDHHTFEVLLKNNAHNRRAHHHVFNLELIKQIVQYAGFTLQMQTVAPPFHLVTIATKNKA